MNRFSVLVLILIGGLSAFSAQRATAVEVLSANELALHCKHFPTKSTSIDGEFCARYIQGFIDGAVATDVRVMLNVQAELSAKNAFTDRAMRTRAPSRSDQNRAAQYADFCLGDPVPLKDVVLKVVGDLEQQKTRLSGEAAREVVYASLRKHYPCKPQ